MAADVKGQAGGGGDKVRQETCGQPCGNGVGIADATVHIGRNGQRAQAIAARDRSPAACFNDFRDAGERHRAAAGQGDLEDAQVSAGGAITISQPHLKIPSEIAPPDFGKLRSKEGSTELACHIRGGQPKGLGPRRQAQSQLGRTRTQVEDRVAHTGIGFQLGQCGATCRLKRGEIGMGQAQLDRNALRADPRLGQDQRGNTGQGAYFFAPEGDDIVQRAAACLGPQKVHRDGGYMGTALA